MQGSSGVPSTVTLTPSMVRSPMYCFMLVSCVARPRAPSRSGLDLTRDHPHDVAITMRLSQRSREHHLAAFQNIDPVDVIGNMVDVGFRNQDALPHRPDRGDPLGN